MTQRTTKDRLAPREVLTNIADGIERLEQAFDVLASEETVRSIARLVTARHLELAQVLLPDRLPEYIEALEREMTHGH